MPKKKVVSPSHSKFVPVDDELSAGIPLDDSDFMLQGLERDFAVCSSGSRVSRGGLDDDWRNPFE